METSIVRRWLSAILVAAVAVPPALAQRASSSATTGLPSTGSARLEGKILRSDAKTPVVGAVVRACYLEGDQVLASHATGPRGQYQITALPQGYVDLTVETPEGFFVANQVVNFLPGAKMVVDFVLVKFADRPAAWWGGRERKEAPCSSQSALGSAEIAQKGTARQFVRSPKGIALIAGLGGVVLLIAASGRGRETPASASAP